MSDDAPQVPPPEPPRPPPRVVRPVQSAPMHWFAKLMIGLGIVLGGVVVAGVVGIGIIFGSCMLK